MSQTANSPIVLRSSYIIGVTAVQGLSPMLSYSHAKTIKLPPHLSMDGSFKFSYYLQ